MQAHVHTDTYTNSLVQYTLFPAVNETDPWAIKDN